MLPRRKTNLFDGSSIHNGEFRGFEPLESNYVEIPEQILTVPGLDGRERWTLAALVHLTVGRAMKRQAENREPFGFHPLSYATLGQVLGLESRSGVKERLANLKSEGLIEIQPGVPAGLASGPVEGDIGSATLARFRLRWNTDQDSYSKTDIRAGWSSLVSTKVPKEIFEVKGLSSMERMALLGIARATIGEAFRKAGEVYVQRPISYRQLGQLLGIETPAKVRELLNDLRLKGFLELQVGQHLGEGVWSKPLARLKWAGMDHRSPVSDTQESEIHREGTENHHTQPEKGSSSTNFDRGSTEIIRVGTNQDRDGTESDRGDTKTDIPGPNSGQALVVPPPATPPSVSSEAHSPKVTNQVHSSLPDSSLEHDLKDEMARRNAMEDLAYLLGQVHGDKQVRMERDVQEFVEGTKLTPQVLADVLRGMLHAIQSSNPKRNAAARRHYDLLETGRLFEEHVVAWGKEGRAGKVKNAPHTIDAADVSSFAAIRKNPRVAALFNQWKRMNKEAAKSPHAESFVEVASVLNTLAAEIQKSLPESLVEEISSEVTSALEKEGNSKDRKYIWDLIWKRRYNDRICALAGLDVTTKPG